MAVGRGRAGDRGRAAEAQEIPCPKCDKPMRLVKRVKNREMGVAGGMYYSCSSCEYARKK